MERGGGEVNCIALYIDTRSFFEHHMLARHNHPDDHRVFVCNHLVRLLGVILFVRLSAKDLAATRGFRRSTGVGQRSGLGRCGMDGTVFTVAPAFDYQFRSALSEKGLAVMEISV